MGMIMEWTPVPAEAAETVRRMDEDDFVDWLEEDGRPVFEVDKLWHGLHFVLTGTAWEPGGPLGDVVLGGEEFGEDLGYGPSRWLPPHEVARLADALEALGADAFVERIDFAAMTAEDVYPSVWDREDEQPMLVDELRGAFETVRDGYRAAATAGHGMVISLL